MGIRNHLPLGMDLTYSYEIHLLIDVVLQKGWCTKTSCLQSYISVTPLPMPEVLNGTQMDAVHFGLGNSLFLCFHGWLDLLLVEKSSFEIVRISRQIPVALTGSHSDFYSSVLHFYAQIHWLILYFHPVSSPCFFIYEMAFIRCSL